MLNECNKCGEKFISDELKLTEQGFGCPYCGSINYNGYPEPKSNGYKWEEANVKYMEGNHD